MYINDYLLAGILAIVLWEWGRHIVNACAAGATALGAALMIPEEDDYGEQRYRYAPPCRCCRRKYRPY
jgi:hypothetical protein